MTRRSGPAPPRVVVVGAGVAGLVAARALASSCEVTVVDKGRGVGGRMATRRIGAATLDHGAQFVTTHSTAFADMVGEWTAAGVVRPWFRGRVGPTGVSSTDGHVRYRGVATMNAVAKHLAEGLEVATGTRVTRLAATGDGWLLLGERGPLGPADAVVLTAPVPQSLDLLDGEGVVVDRARAAELAHIAYDPCLAVLAPLRESPALPEPGAVDPADGPVDWLADNQAKGVSAVPAVTIHATGEWSRRHWEAPDTAVVAELAAAVGLAPLLVPGGAQVQRWRYARPVVGHPERCLLLDAPLPVVLAGDAFGEAKVEGAARSGLAAAAALAGRLGLVGA